VAADFDVVELDDESLEVLDFSDELDFSLELELSLLELSPLDDELDLAEPLVDLFADSRLSVR
jgi:hypothetical protein